MIKVNRKVRRKTICLPLMNQNLTFTTFYNCKKAAAKV